MAASYPSAVKTFTTKSDGAGNTINAAHINDLQDEVNAIEAGILNGTAPVSASNASFVNLSVTGGSTFGTVVLGNSTLSNLSVSGGSTTASLVVSGGSTLAKLQVTGGSTLASLGVSGGSTLGSVTVSSAAPSAPVANTLYADLMPKAWARVTSSGEILGSVNISSVTLTATAVLNFAFATALASSNYAVIATLSAFNSTTHSNDVIGCRVQASSGFSVQTESALPIGVVVFGAQ